ncbi:MAG: heat shock protein HspQ [Pseudomonadota bacterium]
MDNESRSGKFSVGQIVWHERFNYRGVIFDVDPEFMLPDEWYDKVAKYEASREQPWYKVLVDGTDQEAYVAEQHLCEMLEAEPIQHEAVDHIFDRFEDGKYLPGYQVH